MAFVGNKRVRKLKQDTRDAKLLLLNLKIILCWSLTSELGKVVIPGVTIDKKFNHFLKFWTSLLIFQMCMYVLMLQQCQPTHPVFPSPTMQPQTHILHPVHHNEAGRPSTRKSPLALSYHDLRNMR